MDSTTAFDLFTALDVLGLAWPCTLDQLKAAYRLALDHLPPPSQDRGGLVLVRRNDGRRSGCGRGGCGGRRAGRRPDPTADQFGRPPLRRLRLLQRAAFLAGALPRCLLNFSRKSKRTRGFFAPHRWEGDGGRTHDARLYTEDDVHAVEASFRARAAEGERTPGMSRPRRARGPGGASRKALRSEDHRY